MTSADPDWTALHAALERDDRARAEGWLRAVAAASLEAVAQAAALALHLGRPRLAAHWATDPLTHAAAWLRLGQPAEACAALDSAPDSARRSVLLARAGWQQALTGHTGSADSVCQATAARTQARQEGDVGALAAAAALLAEIHCAGVAPDPKLALRTLAEGLKVAELTGQAADAALLATLSHVQARVGSPSKARRTAEKALARSAPRSPARVLALLALGQPAEAGAQAGAGELAPVWWQVWAAQLPQSR